MTNYLLGVCNTKYAETDSNINSYGPAYQHVFDEESERVYLKIKDVENGHVTFRYLELTTRCYVDESEITGDEIVLDIEEVMN